MFILHINHILCDHECEDVLMKLLPEQNVSLTSHLTARS